MESERTAGVKVSRAGADSIFGRRSANAIDDEHIQRGFGPLQLEAEACQPIK
jgi:hypothetical protein